MITINDKSRCSGCTACYTACPKHAITMVPDKLGFKYPVVNKELCVECGLCVKVCSFCTPQLNDNPQRVFVARNLNSDEIRSSRSGAIFPELYKTILKDNGVVYGAAFDKALNVVHKAAYLEDSCREFKGSKYVQSELGDTFNCLIKELKEGKTVLFSGTPCQVSGLLSVVPSSLKSKLYTVDIICHGVPSPKLFNDYLERFQRVSDSIIGFNFRDKDLKGWDDHRESLTYENKGKVYSTLYTQLFYSNAFFRDSCYACPFANTKRPGDITLGDFWGWEKVDMEINKDNIGCSLLYINTTKGELLFEKVKDRLYLISTDIEHSLQRNLQQPTPKPNNRESLVKLYITNGYSSLINKYYRRSLLDVLKQVISRCLSIIKK